MNLPLLVSAYRWSREAWGDALRCGAIEPMAQHVFTTRQLQLRAPDGLDGWTSVAASLHTTPERLLRIKQVHGRHVRVVKAKDFGPDAVARWPEADAIVCNAADAILAVQVADCVPMLMIDPRTRAAAAVHAGWRGTSAGIGAATVEALTREFGSRPSDVHVAMGPSIGACCYEVGDELIAAFRAAGAVEGVLARLFTRTANGSLRLDLWSANREQLAAAGVPLEQIHVARLCTQTHAGVFDSYRAHGARAGRMAAAIRVPSSD